MYLLRLFIVIQILSSCGSSSVTYNNANCQAIYDTLVKKQVYTFVDQMPEYPGGNAALIRFLLDNFKYPGQDTFQASFQLEFVIDNDGKLIGSRIRNKNETELSEAEKEILKVIDTTPKWQAGKCDGKYVPVKMSLPLKL